MTKTFLKLIIVVFFFLVDLIKFALLYSDSCDAHNVECDYRSNQFKLPPPKIIYPNRKYLLHEVNPGEGFNLRRDVYMRVASLVHKVRQDTEQDWVLVLPPWGPLYHWKSIDLYQEQMPWSAFFDTASLSRYVPTVEFHQFIQQHEPVIDEIFYLQHFQEMGTSLYWKETVEQAKCREEPPYRKINSKIYGWFWGYDDIFAKSLKCLSVQGTSSTLKPLLIDSKFSAIMIERAEVILHDEFGNADYWTIRRSMRFSKNIRNVGDEFRMKYLKSFDTKDETVKSENWETDIHKERSAIGGAYLAVHMRRRDFVLARANHIPNITNTALQINEKLNVLNLKAVFIATDAASSEFHMLKKLVPGAVRFEPDNKVREKLKDGGIAAVDQWICSHARYFIGTYESTFSFRIHEEREILGFHPDTTFNRLCGDDEIDCKQPTQWLIVYP